MDDNTRVRVYRVLEKVTGRKIDHVNLEQDLKSQLELDSIQIVELFALLENEFGIELPLSMLTVRTGTSFLKILDDQLIRKL
jgi:acyl carrier protein